MKEISRWLGETAKPQSKTPACVTTIEASDAVPLETVIVALRDELPAFSATVKVKEPSPVPEDAESVSHAESLVADQSQDASATSTET